MEPVTGGQGTRRAGLLAMAALLAVSAALPYANTFDAPFVFDDVGNILKNPSIRSLWPLWKPFWAPLEIPMAGRPLTNFTYAVNFALGGENPWGYHAANCAIHVLCALVLFGICRRTFLTGPLRKTYGAASTPLAFLITLLWAVHPLQTESVTYISQRAESLMGLFYLLTLYCALRGWGSPSPKTWHAAAALCFLLGAGAKEAIVSAPLSVFFYDVVFMGRAPRKALKHSPVLYGGLTLGLILLGVLAAAGRAGSGGPPKEPFTPWEYLYHQPEVLAHYVFLAFWPGPLCIDYLWKPLSPLRALPHVLLFSALLAATVLALWRKSPWGFIGAWFFLILAPASSIIPLPDMAFEHRMYLPLAAVAALLVMGGYRAVQGLDIAKKKGRALGASLLALCTIAAFVLGIRSFLRNRDYASDLALWTDTVKKAPENARARFNLAIALDGLGRREEANGCLRETIRMCPTFAAAHYNLGSNLMCAGKPGEGARHLAQAVFLEPQYTNARLNLGNALHYLGKDEDAILQYRAVLRADPCCADAYANLGLVLAWMGRLEEARRSLRRALYINPRHSMALKCQQALEGL